MAPWRSSSCGVAGRSWALPLTVRLNTKQLAWGLVLKLKVSSRARAGTTRVRPVRSSAIPGAGAVRSGIIIVRTGFVRLSCRTDDGTTTVHNTYGLGLWTVSCKTHGRFFLFSLLGRFLLPKSNRVRKYYKILLTRILWRFRCIFKRNGFYRFSSFRIFDTSRGKLLRVISSYYDF